MTLSKCIPRWSKFRRSKTLNWVLASTFRIWFFDLLLQRSVTVKLWICIFNQVSFWGKYIKIIQGGLLETVKVWHCENRSISKWNDWIRFGQGSCQSSQMQSDYKRILDILKGGIFPAPRNYEVLKLSKPTFTVSKISRTVELSFCNAIENTLTQMALFCNGVRYSFNLIYKDWIFQNHDLNMYLFLILLLHLVISNVYV